jgi:hypothetical protein
VVGSWSVISGNATIASPTQALTTVTFAGLGPVSLLWTVYNGPCGETSDQVTINVADCGTGVGDHTVTGPVMRFDPEARTVVLSGAGARAGVVLLDAMGRQIATTTVDGNGVLRWSMAGLPAGWYTVHVEDPAHARLLRFLLAH